MLMQTAGQMTACKVCSTMFAQMNSMHSICSPKCAFKLPTINRKAAKAERQETKRRLEAIKPRSKWQAEAQAEVNKYVRLRDAALGCISCNTHTGKMNGGHYLSVGARPELRFNVTNIHKQCERCNSYLHGNLIPYRVELIRRIGLEAVEWLEGPHPAQKLTVDDLKEVRNTYRAKIKALENEEAPA